MSNFITDAVGSFAGDIQYAFGGGSSAQARSDATMAQLNAVNQQDYAPGGQIYNAIADVNGSAAADAAYQQVQQDAAKSASGGTVLNQLQTAGQAGAAQGLSNLAGKIQSAVSGIFGVFTKLMPWQAWAGLALLAFWYLGGFKWLKGSLEK